MKPRRWYSSAEVNPLPHLPQVRPQITKQLMHYTAKVRQQHGPVLTTRTGPLPFFSPYFGRVVAKKGEKGIVADEASTPPRL